MKNSIIDLSKKERVALEVKIKESVKVGDSLLTWMDSNVIVKEIRTDKKLKPLVVDYNGKTNYFHFDQIVKIN